MKVTQSVQVTNNSEKLPWFLWLNLGPLIILSVAAAYMYLNWNQIPQTFPVHWGINGQPNRWHSRTTQNVFGFIFFGLELCVFLVILSLSIWYGARRTTLRRTTLAVLVEGAYACSLLFALIAASPLFHPPPPAIYSLVAVFAASTVVIVKRASSLAGQLLHEQYRHSELVYSNPDDAALFVEKKVGFGYNLNFANRWSWLIAGIFLALIGSAPFLLK